MLVTGLAGCGATVVHDLVYNPAEGEICLCLCVMFSISSIIEKKTDDLNC